MPNHIHPRLCALFLALLAPVALSIQAQTIIASDADNPARVIVKFKADSSLTLQTRALSAGAREASRAQALGARTPPATAKFGGAGRQRVAMRVAH